MAKDKIGPDSLRASLKSMGLEKDRFEVVVRITNAATRALHYISDVRATRYDPATRTLTLALSDEGRQVIPGAVHQLPVFRHIAPGGEAEIRLSVPSRVIKLSRSAPPGQLAFEKHQMSDAREIVVEIAWADVPYYKDTRPSTQTKDLRLPAERWQQFKAKVSQRLEKNPGAAA